MHLNASCNPQIIMCTVVHGPAHEVGTLSGFYLENSFWGEIKSVNSFFFVFWWGEARKITGHFLISTMANFKIFGRGNSLMAFPPKLLIQ